MPGNRRYQIFISSTFKDLQEERKQAVEVIFEMGHIPIALERFSPANESDLQVIKKVIADCQIYILILGHKYGEIVPNESISYTELEYNIAEENGLTILTFMLEMEDVEELRKSLDALKEKDLREYNNYERYLSFRKRIRQFRRMWKKHDQFKYLVALALHENLEKCDKPGFVRESEEPMMSLLASASRNEFIVDIVDKLKSFNKLYDRCLHEIELKKELADFFRERYLDKLINNKVSLFLESGSTIAYVTRAISETLSRVVKTKDQGKPNIHICTSNVLAYLQLWLISKVPCTTFPWSPPTEDTYGALYGSLMRVESRQPTYNELFLDDAARSEIQRLWNTPFGITQVPKPTLLLCTTSGLQVSMNHRLKFQEELGEGIREELRPQLKSCFGPHVGSYRNMVFKRFLYETRIPIMFFITGEKIDCEIDVGKCHFVFDSQFSWPEFFNNSPVAFCVGCTQERRQELINLFKGLGFDVLIRTCCSPNE
ncbi:MAG: DUF4062 domain-containing protein [Desulfobacteraceae bacterium]|nr:DUF4062 domain-containing protein [Desulfobacteraceae bacterium]